MILDNTNLNTYIHQIEVEVVNSYTTSLDVTFIMSLFKHRSNGFRSGVALVAGIAALVSVSSLAGADGARQPRPATRGCADFGARQAGLESHDIYDPRTKTVLVDTPEGDFLLAESNPECTGNAAAAQRLTAAKAVGDQAKAGMCDGFRGSIERGDTRVKGIPVDLDVAREYARNEC